MRHSRPVTETWQGASDRAQILGCAIDRLDMRETLARIEKSIEAQSFAQHVAINAAKIVAMRSDRELRKVVEQCQIVSADGQSVVWASRLLGDPLPERVTGIDLMVELLALAERRGLRVYILGARPDVLDRALHRIKERHPALEIAGARDGYYAAEEEADVADAIRRSRSDMLFVAMSSPKKELFLGRYGRTIDVPFVMGVGGTIDVLAGITSRAPRIWQAVGLEWLYRLLQEPRRLGKRYVSTNAAFIALVARAMLQRAIARS
jgi:N-acetylglucosaminyldiphosphoundecaprenol N-acetyl-beta-D-mannosaminyltransferase